MKKVLMAVVALALVAMAGTAMAADSNSLTVLASVRGTCKFSSATSTLTFPPLDPSVAGPVNGSTTTQFWCTKGVTTDAITAGNGNNWSGTSRQMLDSVSSDTIAYSLGLAVDGAANTGPAAPRTLTISGTVQYADFSAKSAGDYSDTVVLTLTP